MAAEHKDGISLSLTASIGRREIVDAKKAPWRSIGRLNKLGHGFCTAFLVKPSWIMTAAHCLWNKDTGRFFTPKDLHFLAGYQRETYQAHAQGKALVINPKFRPGLEPNLENMVNDWAFIQLDQPIGNELGYLDISPISAAELAISGRKVQKKNAKIHIVQAGYSRDFRYVITANTNCRLRQAADFVLFAHDCEVFKGDSGSPVLLISDNSARVIALHVGTLEKKGVRTGLAVPASSFEAAGNLTER